MSSPVGRPSIRKSVRLLRIAACLALVAFAGAADQPARPAAPPAEPPKSDSAVQPAVRENEPRPGLDNLKLPPGSIIVISEETKDALRLMPRGLLISPELYQKLLDEIDRLKGPSKPEKPVTPTGCRLTGRVDGDIVRLQAEFTFNAERRGTLVALSCGQAQPSSVTLDGQVPILHYSSTEGYVLQVDEPGPHKAVLELELPAGIKGAGTFRGFDLDLPRAPVTTLNLDLSPTVKEVRVGKRFADGRVVGNGVNTRPSEDRKHARLETGGLGPVERLELSWKGPVVRSFGPPVLTADGRITVQVHETFVETTAEIMLNVLRGQTSQWQLQLPPQASLELQTADGDDRLSATVEQTTPKSPLRTIRLKEATTEPIKAVIRMQQPRGQGPVPIGPFHVLGTFRQRGTILLAAPADVRLRYAPRSEVTPRELTADDNRSFKATAAFSYWNLPTPEKPQALPAPLLNLEFETIKGLIEVQTDYTLELTESGWQVRARLKVNPPLRGDVRELQIELPAGFELERRRRVDEPDHDVRIDPDPRIAVLTLAEKQLKRFEVTLEGLYPPPAADARQAVLELPRLVKSEQTLDRGGTMTVAVPRELELVAPVPVRESVRREAPNRHSWTLERVPPRVEVAWRRYRPDLPVESFVDILLTGTQAKVEHRLWSPAPQTLANQFPLRVPAAVADRPIDIERGRLTSGGRDGAAHTITLTEPVTRANPLVLKYSFPLPTRTDERGQGGEGQPFSVLLVVPEQATRGETRVRIWSDPGSRPVLAGGSWEETPKEAIEGRDRLTDLCLRGARPDLPLALRLSEPAAVPQATVLVERALVRATVEQAGQHSYWASFRLSQLRAPYLDLELPAAPAGLGLKVYLDGTGLGWGPVNEAAASPETARLARLEIDPARVTRPVVLDVIYHLAPNQPAARSTGYMLGNVALQTTLYAPLLHGSGDHVPTRWDVRLPSDWVPLYTGGGFQFEQRWGWRGWLLAPRPAVSSADLDHWFAGDTGERASATVAEDAAGPERGAPSVVCWRTDLEPLRLNHAPQQAWILTCSLVLLVVGLGLWFLLVHRGLYWPVVVLLGVVAALVGLLWPSVLAVVFYGCQPGLAVLLLLLGFQSFLQRRYRRQVVFLPGFTRLKGGSSLIRSGPRADQPSTVDEPTRAASGSSRKVGSSVSRGGSGSQPGTGR